MLDSIGVGDQRQALASLAPGKGGNTHGRRLSGSHGRSGRGGSHGRSGRSGKFPLPPDLLCSFVFCTLFYSFLCLDCPAFCLFCLYLSHTTQTSMPPEGFVPATVASDRPQTLALDHSATRIGGLRSPELSARIKSLLRLRFACPQKCI